MIQFEAVVADARLESHAKGVQRWRVLLTKTEFSVRASTGKLEAVARSGARLEVPVLGVVEEDGEVWHVVEKPLGAGASVTGLVAAAGEAKG